MARNIVGNLKFKKIEEGGFDPIKFGEMVEEAYLSGNKRDSFTKKKTFSPSTIGYGHGNCARYWFIAFTGAEFDDTFDAQAVANMSNGTSAHDRIQKVIEKTGTLKGIEIEVLNDDPPIRGFMDLILEWEGEEVAGEIKTIKSDGYAIRQSTMSAPGYHQLQLLSYMKNKGIKQGFFYYENKDTQEILLIPINMNERNTKLIDDAWDWLRKVYANFEAGTLPNRAFTKSQSACKYCPVKKVCWKELGDGEVEIEAMVPPK
jgi:CRISPR/Cas system-associated exonuclease Cas4 (RecB family)